jgi:hypothetical protein
VPTYTNRKARPGEINHGPFDRWTLGHLGAGWGFGLFRAPWWVALGAAIGWEIIENPLKRHVFRSMVGSTQDTTVNSIVDMIVFMAGWGMVKALPPPVRRRE